jgi:hypothetical protein
LDKLESGFEVDKRRSRREVPEGAEEEDSFLQVGPDLQSAGARVISNQH